MPTENRGLLDDITQIYNGRVVGPFRMLLHSPELAWRVSEVGRQLRVDTPLAADARETAILVVARELDCLYEWYAHEPAAQRAGVRQEVIDAIRNRDHVDGLTPGEAMVVDYTREVLQSNRVSDDTFQAARERLGVQGTVDLTVTIGFYRLLACQLNAFEVDPDGPVDLPIP